jgi:hypothetical protein
LRVPTRPSERRKPSKVARSATGSTSSGRESTPHSKARSKSSRIATLCSCTQSPGAIGLEAKPMTWPNLRTGSPGPIAATASLWPRETRAPAVTPSSAVPARMGSTATRTLSLAWRRMVRGVVEVFM